MKSRPSPIVVLALLLALGPGLAARADAGSSGAKKAHLGVTPNKIVNVRTYNLPNDSSYGEFFYDRGNELFRVPEGYSFVVTDIIVHPYGGVPSPTDYVVAFVKIAPAGARSFGINIVGGETRHYAFAGAMVMPGGHTPTARNLQESTVDCEFQLIGYFVKAEALPEYAPAFPPPLP